MSTKWNVSRPGYNSWCDDERKAAAEIDFQEQTMTLVGAFKNHYSAFSEHQEAGKENKYTLVEVTVQRDACSGNCGSSSLRLWVGKVWSKNIYSCQPSVQCMKVAEMNGGSMHLAVYGECLQGHIRQICKSLNKQAVSNRG